MHTVRVDEALTQLPYLRPLYDEPEFVVRNVWRRYGGWWDGDPSHLKPAPADALAVELAAQAAPEDPSVHEVRADLYERRRRQETSLMTKGIFAAAVADSRTRAGLAPD